MDIEPRPAPYRIEGDAHDFRVVDADGDEMFSCYSGDPRVYRSVNGLLEAGEGRPAVAAEVRAMATEHGGGRPRPLNRGESVATRIAVVPGLRSPGGPGASRHDP
ncbi:MAG: hypothetical protein AAF205_00155 [Pseudomonadota bacterium]